MVESKIEIVIQDPSIALQRQHTIFKYFQYLLINIKSSCAACALRFFFINNQILYDIVSVLNDSLEVGLMPKGGSTVLGHDSSRPIGIYLLLYVH